VEGDPLSDADADFETLAIIQQNFAAFEKAVPLLLEFIAQNDDKSPES